ncbi:MAG: hypothetical protein LBV64_03845 [Mediterranea sp.]|jgi:hypothetical protein|nr:hypothetical protein [Mediterranea sp.]
MIMKLLNFKKLYPGILLFVFSSAVVFAQNGYDKRVEKRQTQWDKLIPTHTKMQFAGGMGILSLGGGWDYGKNNQWETDVFLGFLPKYSTDKTKILFTLKQNFIPWEKNFNECISLDPLSCGLYINTIFDDDFWVHELDKYPNNYYSFSTKMRFNIYVGQRLTYKIPHDKRFFSKSVTFFYEISSNELYIVSAFTNSYLKPKDYLRLSFGIKLQLI